MQNTPMVVLVGGCFDILHAGHIHFLESARSLGDTLTVIVESDANIMRKKNKMPYHNQIERMHNLRALRTVDTVIALTGITSHDEYIHVTKEIHPQIIATTKGDLYIDQKKSVAAVCGARVVEIAQYKNYSSSHIIAYARTL